MQINSNSFSGLHCPIAVRVVHSQILEQRYPGGCVTSYKRPIGREFSEREEETLTGSVGTVRMYAKACVFHSVHSSLDANVLMARKGEQNEE
jgi:hypothetical protein